MNSRSLCQRAILWVALALATVSSGATPAWAQSPPPVAAPSFDDEIAGAKAAMLADPHIAESRAHGAEALAARLPASSARATQLATAVWLQGEAALRTNDVQRAQPLIDRALTLLGPNAPATKLKGDVMLTRGGVHAATARVGDALTDYHAAHDIFRDIGETRSQSIALLSIAALYSAAEDHPSALKYYGRALEVYRGDPGLALSIFNNRGDALMQLKHYDEAQKQFEHALASARDMKSGVLQARVLGNIARLQLARGDLHAADATIARGLALTGSGDGAVWRGQLSAIAAEAALRHGNLAAAEKLIDATFAAVDLGKTTLTFREAHETAYKVYSRTGRKELALAHLEAMKRLDDETAKLTASATNALVAAKFDFSNQELKISKLRADDLARKIAMEQAQSRFQRILFGSIGAAVLLVTGLLAFGLVQSRRSRVRLSLSNTALEKALAAKTEFLATTSHEIRTPLNGILGMTQVMLADPALSAAARDRVGIVHGAGLTMRALVDDILDVAKMETGNLTVEAVPFDLKAMLSDVTRIWESQAKAKGLAFELDLGSCPHGILGDAARLRQVVFNLLSNAVKFTDTGAITLTASCGGDRLRIAIRDTGIGIPADKHDEIFESFKQADGATTRKYGGTGLGLAICRNIATAMGGSVLVESIDGQGATFTLDVPFAAADVEVAPAPVAGGGLLIVDRNPIARAMLKAVLEPRAGSVAFASTLADAETAITAGGVATLLIDEATAKASDDHLAALTGLAAAANAAGVDSSILWATPADTDRANLLATGIQRVIAKPIAGPALADALYSSQGRNEPLASRAA